MAPEHYLNVKHHVSHPKCQMQLPVNAECNVIVIYHFKCAKVALCLLT